MLAAIGAASAIFDALTSSIPSVSSPSRVTTGFTGTPATSFDIGSTTTISSGAGSASTSGASPPASNLSPDTLSALLAAQGQQPTATTSSTSKSKSDAMNDLFSLLDSDGNGQISKSEFEGALGAGGTNVAQADDVFSKMDTNGDGSISLDEMASALKPGRGHHAHHAHAGGAKGGGGGGDTNALMQALDGASSTTTTNSDGSTTTSLTYADGSKVTLTTPASTTTSTAAASSYNFVEQAIQRQAQALMTSNAASIATSA